MLVSRSLRSVLAQTCKPDMLVVVDDSDLENRKINKTIIDKISATEDIKTTYLENRRTSGAAGAWNTALAYLQDIEPSVFVAILDDDDVWKPEYLARCKESISKCSLDMAVAGIIYHKTADDNGVPLGIPNSLSVKDMLVTNTGIQGSNIFIRLSTILEAGGFDESMTSTTDRDICIRLADLNTVKYGTITEHLVHHYAETGRPRLSTPGTKVKRSGLEYFFDKYQYRMSDAIMSAFVLRSKRLFHFNPQHTPPVFLPRQSTISDNKKPEYVLDLIVGAITSPDVTLITNLMRSLNIIFSDRSDVRIKIILLENGGPNNTNRDALRNAVKHASTQGLDITVITLEDQRDSIDAGKFFGTKEKSNRKSIAQSRTMLQHYLFMEAITRDNPVVWILDDDVILESLSYRPDGTIGIQDVDYVSGIRQLRETGADVVLCQETGEAPVPALSCIRTQMVDLYYNLIRISTIPPGEPYTNLQDENRASRLTNNDYYYDLSSSRTDHLERPFWYESNNKDNSSAEDVFCEMVQRLPDIFDGVQVFRPLVSTEQSSLTITPSLIRGPGTLVFDLYALRDFPNTSPSVNGTKTRRSDMIWSLLNRFVSGRRIVRANLPIHHARSKSTSTYLDFEVLLHDILGHALYSSLYDSFASRATQISKQDNDTKFVDLLYFDQQQIQDAVNAFERYLHKRVAAFELNFIRTQGVLSALKHLIELDPAPWWWQNKPECTEHAHKLKEFIELLTSTYTDSCLDIFKKQIVNIDNDAIRQFLVNLPETVRHHRSNTTSPSPKDPYWNAEDIIKTEFKTGPLRRLGAGKEGVAFTDGRLLAYKYLYCAPIEVGAFLQSLEGKLSEYQTLPDIVKVRQIEQREDSTVIVIAHTYKSGTAYVGGHLDKLLIFVQECLKARIACRNIHPNNLIVTPTGLKFIDPGADLVPITDNDFEHMCRRAWLACRFATRADLKRKMRQSLKDASLAELNGLKQFRNAASPRGFKAIFYQPMADLVGTHHRQKQYKTMLDYGCGDGQIAEAISNDTINVTGYDIDTEGIKKCQKRKSQVKYGGTELRARLLANSVRFDAIMCNRVLCTIVDDSEFDLVLQDLKELVTDDGTIFVAVCNPFFLTSPATELNTEHLPKRHMYEHKFTYTKTLTESKKCRTEVHRSYDIYRRAFNKAGLFIQRTLEFDGTDTRSVLPASEHLVFELSRDPANTPRVSLLIKTSSSDKQYVTRIVQHIVEQLESPFNFVEKVLVIYLPHGNQDDNTDLDNYHQTIKQMLDDSITVHVTQESKTIRSTYQRLSGDRDKPHLLGFDSCTADYILQVDADVLIWRTDKNHNYISEMVDILRDNHKALFVSLDICRNDSISKDTHSNALCDVRLYDRQRLLSELATANKLEEDEQSTQDLSNPITILDSNNNYRSHCYNSCSIASIHIPDAPKIDDCQLHDIISSIERGHIPNTQFGKAELVTSVAKDWAGPKRDELFVFIIYVHQNVGHARFKRCIQSMLSQKGQWGAIIIDDCSTNGLDDYAKMLLDSEHVTFIHNEQPHGASRSIWNAVANVCVNPETVIIVLNPDCVLIGDQILESIQTEYTCNQKTDLTAGTTLQPCKEYVGVKSDEWKMSAWEHLRTFKKRLLDSIPVKDFMIDWKWSDQSVDGWDIMAAIAKTALNLRFISKQLCLYDPPVATNE